MKKPLGKFVIEFRSSQLLIRLIIYLQTATIYNYIFNLLSILYLKFLI